MGRSRSRAALAALGLALVGVYSWIWYRNAWITDDPFITFRTVEQLFGGHGLRFNPNERVQAFTHPLWLALLAPARALGVNLPIASLALSWGAAVGALAALAGLARGAGRWAAAVALLAVSRTLLDYSSSGLETPLSILLVVLFVALALGTGRPEEPAGGSLVPLAALAAALLLTRHDHAPLVVPALALLAARRMRAASAGRAVRELSVGLSPLVAWSLFALFYYGSTLPNTGLAKLATGVPARELARQGVRYLLVSAGWDPLLLPLFVLGGWAAWRGGTVARALGLGGVLHVTYVVAIGGDFMAGRFLLPAAALALALAVARAPRGALELGALPVALLLGLLWARSPLRMDEGYRPAWRLGDSGRSGIVDEKGNPPGSQWLREQGPRDWPRPAGEPAGPPRVLGVLGRPGYRASLDQILVDPYALADPFLARLPHDPPWQIGHFRRRLPAGYLESLAAGDNRLEDPELAALYADVRRLVSAPLLDPGRAGAWWRLATRTRASAPEPRCPGLSVAQAPPSEAEVHRAVMVETVEQEGARLLVRGRLPLGERAAAWRLRAWPLDPARAARLTCHPEAEAAPIRFVLELRFADEASARRAADAPPALALLPARPGEAPR